MSSGPQSYYRPTAVYPRTGLRRPYRVTSNPYASELYTEYIPGALIFCTQPVPVASGGEMRVEVEVHDATAGDIFWVFVCCTSSTQIGTGTGVKFEYLGSSVWRTTIPGTPSECSVQQTSGLVNDAYLWVCVDHEKEMLSAGIVCPDEVYAWNDQYEPQEGRYVALGHDNPTTGVKFDNFELYELRIPSNDRCVTCWCQCLQEPIKRTLILEMFNTSFISGNPPHYFLSTMEGFKWTLEWEFNAGFPRWYAAADASADYPWDTMDFIFNCQYNWWLYPDDPGKNTSLAWDYEPAGPQPDTDLSTCEPLYLVWGPYTVGDFHDPPPMWPEFNCTNEYWFRITEA